MKRGRWENQMKKKLIRIAIPLSSIIGLILAGTAVGG
jgi:hypothetical protein